MIDFPKSQLPQYLKLLEKRGVPAANFAECIKWSRYFLDYCSKYPAPDSDSERVRLFIDKLKAKKQSDLQCRQAAYAVSVFFESQQQEEPCPQTTSESADKKESAKTVMEETGERRRYHLHESHLQEALYFAVRKAKIPKRVTAYTFRHSFATHLLQAKMDGHTELIFSLFDLTYRSSNGTHQRAAADNYPLPHRRNRTQVISN